LFRNATFSIWPWDWFLGNMPCILNPFNRSNGPQKVRKTWKNNWSSHQFNSRFSKRNATTRFSVMVQTGECVQRLTGTRRNNKPALKRHMIPFVSDINVSEIVWWIFTFC
jgi:hypothetical protein